jgi:hypothetical protein
MRREIILYERLNLIRWKDLNKINNEEKWWCDEKLRRLILIKNYLNATDTHFYFKIMRRSWGVGVTWQRRVVDRGYIMATWHQRDNDVVTMWRVKPDIDDGRGQRVWTKKIPSSNCYFSIFTNKTWNLYVQSWSTTRKSFWIYDFDLWEEAMNIQIQLIWMLQC